MKRQPKFKTKFISYDWKESPSDVLDDLTPFLKQLGVYVSEDPSCVGTDSFGYILSSKPLKVKDYRKHCRKLYGKREGDELLEDLLRGTQVTENSPMSKLVYYYE